MAAQGAPQPQPQSEQGSASWLSHSDSVLDFIGRFLNVKKHQQEQGAQELQSTIALSQAGFPVDPKTFSKLVKKSGLPIATDPATLQAFYGSEKEKQEGGKDGKGQQQGQGQDQQGQKQGPQPAQMPQGGDPKIQGFVDAHNGVMSSGKPLDAGQMMGHYMNALGIRALNLANTKATTEKQKADNELQVESLKAQGIAGDNEARGRLMRMGDIPVNVDLEKWNTLTDVQRKGMFDIMAGNESPAEKVTRSSRIAESLITSGRLTDPQSAFRAADILASGGQLPSDLQSKMKPYTFKELGDAALLGNALIEQGVPPDKIGSIIRAAQAGGLENALPNGMKPLALQTLQLEKDKLGLEQSRLGIEELRFAKEVEIGQRMAAAETRKGMTDEKKQQLEEFKSLVELKKAGGAVPDDVIKGAQAKAAQALGMDVSEVKTWFNFITGGTKLQFKPRLTEEGKGSIDKFIVEQKKDSPVDKADAFGTFVQGHKK